jgi:ParB-like chromosome segregation protein Spo0J
MKIAAKAPASSTVINSTDAFVPLERIVNHKDLPPRELNKTHVGELTASIKKSGLDTKIVLWGGEQPGTQMKLNGETVDATFLIAGAHRRQALRDLEKEDPKRFKELFPQGIPCVIRVCPLSEALMIHLRENVLRHEMSPEQILPVFNQLIKMGVKQNVIATRIGKSNAWVSMIIDINNNLGEEGVEEVAKGKLTLRDARAASKEVKAKKAAGETVNPKETVAKLKEKLASKRKAGKGQRSEKRASLKTLYSRYTVLPSGKMNVGKKLEILEAICEYVLGESDDLPAEVAEANEDGDDKKKAAKK